jgi:hypothetical protein
VYIPFFEVFYDFLGFLFLKKLGGIQSLKRIHNLFDKPGHSPSNNWFRDPLVSLFRNTGV